MRCLVTNNPHRPVQTDPVLSAVPRLYARTEYNEHRCSNGTLWVHLICIWQSVDFRRSIWRSFKNHT
jgi:hypothetical protein